MTLGVSLVPGLLRRLAEVHPRGCRRRSAGHQRGGAERTRDRLREPRRVQRRRCVGHSGPGSVFGAPEVAGAGWRPRGATRPAAHRRGRRRMRMARRGPECPSTGETPLSDRLFQRHLHGAGGRRFGRILPWRRCRRRWRTAISSKAPVAPRPPATSAKPISAWPMTAAPWHGRSSP